MNLELDFLQDIRLSRVITIVILLIGIFSGCSVGSFIGAYFNTYYNAQKLFTEAEKEVQNAGAAAISSRGEKPFLAPYDAPSQARTKFSSVIEKCSKLLQYHPESQLVDDALLMIGKSYAYQNEYQSAERKFKELLTTYPKSDLQLETKLLLAQTYYRTNDKKSAVGIATEVLEEGKKEGADGLAANAALLLAHVDEENKSYNNAIANYSIAAELGDTQAERSSAFRRIADIYILQTDYKRAADAYARAERASGDYLSTYRAQIGRARMMAKFGQQEESLRLLDELIQDPNNREFFGEIDLQIADVYQDQGDYAAAERQYRYVDTAYARTEIAANSYYKLGLLYETKLFLYDSARVAYNAGRKEFPAAAITPSTLKRADFMNRYFSLHSELAKNDSLHYVILHPPDTTKLITIVPNTTKHDSAWAGKFDSTAAKITRIPPPPIDTVTARLAFNKSELAGLFASFDMADSAEYWYSRVLNDHPHSPYGPRALYTLAQYYRLDSTVAAARTDSLYSEIVTRFPDSEFAAESRRQLGMPEIKLAVDPAETSYVNAESLVKKGELAAALKSFKRITENDTTSSISAKAQYTIGWIYENVRPNVDSSFVYYKRLLRRFPNSQYAGVVQPKVAEVETERQRILQEKAAKDTTSKKPVIPNVPPGDAEEGGRSENKKLPPLPKEMPKDSLREEVPVKKIIPKEDDIPKP